MFLSKIIALICIICISIPPIHIKAQSKQRITPAVLAQASTVSEFVYNSKDLIYTVLSEATSTSRGTVEVSGNNSSMTSISIPNTVSDEKGNVYSVTSIGSRAFEGYDYLRSVTIPENVNTIRFRAFADCTDLDYIKILSTSISLYSDCFDNIDPDAVFYVQNSRVENEIIDAVDEYGDIVRIYDDDDDYHNGEYKLTLKSTKGGSVKGGGYYDYRDTVTIRATANSGYVFDRWVIDSGDVTLDDRYEDRTTFKMPREKVTLTAEFVSEDDYYYNPYTYRNRANSQASNTVVSNDIQVIPLDDFYSDNTGDDLIVDLGNNTNASTSEFEKVLGKNTNITFNLNGYRWIINGKNIATNIMQRGYCNLGVTFKQSIDTNINALTDGTGVGQFNLAYSGTLPFQGKLEFYPQNAHNGQLIYMYDYNQSTNSLIYQDFNTVKENGSIQLTVKNALPHILTTQIVKGTNITQSISSQSGDISTVIPYYLEDNQERIVKLSTQEGNSINFLAPLTTVYYFKDNNKNFSDVTNHWAKPSINFVTSREIFNGVSDNQFAPDDTITKGMFITALANLDEVNPTWYYSGDNGAYYAPYTEWASQNGILNNLQNTNFDSAITREEMALILKNYFEYKDIELPSPNSATIFEDNATISSWAVEAVSLMQQLGIINGKDGNNFRPSDLATRAEASVMFKRFIENII